MITSCSTLFYKHHANFNSATNQSLTTRITHLILYILKSIPIVGQLISLGELLWLRTFKKTAPKSTTNDPYDLAMLYFHGLDGFEKNRKKAFELFTEAAKSGHQKAKYGLGICYLNGDGTEQNKERGFDELYESIPSNPQAFHLLKKHADQNEGKAAYLVGLCYQNGAVVHKNKALCYRYRMQSIIEDKKAFQIVKNAAEKGSKSNSFLIGMCYLFGYGVKADEELGFLRIKYAAERDHSGALYILGMCFLLGKVVKQNRSEAYAWIKRAVILDQSIAQDLQQKAIAGYEDECALIAIFFHQGVGVDRDPDIGNQYLSRISGEAKEWAKKFLEEGNL